jgi:hypothetical protein
MAEVSSSGLPANWPGPYTPDADTVTSSCPAKEVGTQQKAGRRVTIRTAPQSIPNQVPLEQPANFIPLVEHFKINFSEKKKKWKQFFQNRKNIIILIISRYLNGLLKHMGWKLVFLIAVLFFWHTPGRFASLVSGNSCSATGRQLDTRVLPAVLAERKSETKLR